MTGRTGVPASLNWSSLAAIHEFEMEKRMPYVTSIERLATEKGREEGREAELTNLLDIISDGLTEKFGAAGKRLAARVRKCRDVARLKGIARSLMTAKS